MFFTSSGTEANEAALLLATPGPPLINQVLALRNSYHGRSFGTVGYDRQPRLVRLEL
ncbi:MAG: hypothetical protein WKF73_15565 [Nocardioidaceae bacterium]